MTVRMPVLALVCCLVFPVAHADIDTARKYVPDASLVGEARLRYMVWNVYDANLYSPSGKFDPAQPFALSLSYLRNLKGRKIAEKSISEMRAQRDWDDESLARWQTDLAGIIPDVDKNTVLTGVRDANRHTLFYNNGEFIGRIEDPDFTAGFFNIWLGEKTSRPALRRKLIGGPAS